jgi:hypothetical protein
MVEDLADFAEVLQPSLDGMKANKLCRLIEKYAAYEFCPSDLSVSPLARPTGTPNYRPQRELCSDWAPTLHG